MADDPGVHCEAVVVIEKTGDGPFRQVLLSQFGEALLKAGILRARERITRGYDAARTWVDNVDLGVSDVNRRAVPAILAERRQAVNRDVRAEPAPGLLGIEGEPFGHGIERRLGNQGRSG